MHNLTASDDSTISCSGLPWNKTSDWNETSDGTGTTSLSPPEYLYVYVTVASACIFLAGVVGNLLVIYVVVRLQSMRTRMNLFLVSLSVADLMALMVCQPVALLDLYGKERWFLGAFMCKLIPYLENTAVHCSGLSLLAISQERYVAICRPLSVVRKRRSHLLTICLTWFFSLLPCLPFIFMSYLDQVMYYDGSLHWMCLTKTSLTMVKVFLVADFVLSLILPLVAITYFYTAILCVMTPASCCYLQCIGLSSPTGRPTDGQTNNRGKVVKMMVMVVVLFYTCLLPMRSLAMWLVFDSPENVEKLGFEGYLNLMNVARLLMFVNSAVNPVFYGLMSSKFRDAFVSVLPFSWLQRYSNRRLSRSRTPRCATKSPRSSREEYSMNEMPANEGSEV